MNQHRPLLLVASLALAAGVLGACSPGSSSPTEPTIAFDSAAKSFSSTSTASAGDDAFAAKRHGGDDDGSADDNGGGGGGNDDGTADQGRNGGRGGNGDDRRRRGRRGRGGDDNPQQPRAPRGGAEFEATVLDVRGQVIVLATGTDVVVNAQTQWSARGDLRSLSALSAAVAANRAPRVEGRGARQADGSIVAQTIKAEIDN